MKISKTHHRTKTGVIKRNPRKRYNPKIELVSISYINDKFEPFPEGMASEEDVIKMMNFLKAGGKLPPILISKSGYLIDGRHRLEAYKRLGYNKIPVIKGINPSASSIVDRKTGKELKLRRGNVDGQPYALKK